MKPGLLISTLLLPLAAACCTAQAADAPASAAVTATAASAPAAPAVETAAPAAAPATALPAMPPGAPMTMAPTSSSGSLLQTIFALLFVLALLVALAWAMKRFGPKALGGNSKMRVISSLNLGGRERIVLIEVADQWIVVGASPGRINALATLPRQEGEPPSLSNAQNGPAAANFSEWLKQTIEKRNGK